MLELLPLFASAPRGVNDLLIAELSSLGAADLRESPAGVHFSGTLETAYRACLWSRLANRVLLPLAEFSVIDAEGLYRAVREIPWEEHLDPAGTLAVGATHQRGTITHTQFLAQRVKDGVVDRFREQTGDRPSVRLNQPDLRLHIHLKRDRATLSLDLSGDSLHRRGYRLDGATAPLKENLAAAILLRAGWPAVMERGGVLVDPMCGSGTLLIEAALMAARVAPGLRRRYYGFAGWLRHDLSMWASLVQEAEAVRLETTEPVFTILGFDKDPRAVDAAVDNIARAGLGDGVNVEVCSLESLPLERLKALPPGLVVTNPPYGERLGEQQDLTALYAYLGASLREGFTGWRAAVLTGNPELGKCMGLRARCLNKLFNGAIECQLLHFEVEPRWFVNRPPPGAAPRVDSSLADSSGARMFANRLSKNMKALRRWMAQESIRCYRLYDADMPEYNLAVDLYRGKEDCWVHVQEYEAPKSVSKRGAETRLAEAMAALPGALDVKPESIYLKVRSRQRGPSQYQKQSSGGEFHIVEESDLQFAVNFTDYLDTGLFLDHRPTRALIRELAEGRRFLNLFCYTGSATVYAAAGGATASTSVDMSRTYLDWMTRNLALNGFDGSRHALVQADCLEWLKQQAERPECRYGLIFLDPPTFSTSKRMTTSLDIQRDHVELVRQAAALLESDGILLFSTNFRRFKFDEGALPELQIVNISRDTLPKDFARNPKIHHCFRIQHR